MNPIILYRDFGIDPAELEAMKLYFSCTTSRMDIRPGMLVISRYASLPFYKEQENDVNIAGGKLINSYRQHQYIADLANWYQDLEHCTPKTWFRAEDVPMTEIGAFVLKGQTNSKKFLWGSHMLAANRLDVGRILSNLMDDTFINQQNIYVRKYEPLKTYMYGINGLPITREFRFFVAYGKILSGAFYWASHGEELREKYPESEFDASVVPTEFLYNIIGKIGDQANFYAIDVAQTETGEWCLIELNCGTMSGLSENDPAVLYKNLRNVINEQINLQEVK